jgi:hypothetical protein
MRALLIEFPLMGCSDELSDAEEVRHHILGSDGIEVVDEPGERLQGCPC